MLASGQCQDSTVQPNKLIHILYTYNNSHVVGITLCLIPYALSCLFEVKYVNQCLKQINILLTKFYFKTKQNYNHYTEQVS